MIHTDRLQCDTHHLIASDVEEMNTEIVVFFPAQHSFLQYGVLACPFRR